MDAYYAIIEHFQTHYVAYIAVALCVAPLIYVSRRYSLPFIFYTVEIVFYLAAMHLTMWVLVYLAVAFQEATSMQHAIDAEAEKVDWTTPLVQFWDMDAYEPRGLFWFEAIAAVLIIYAVWRFRPMRVKQPRKRSGPGASPAPKKPGPAPLGVPKSYRGRGAGPGPR